MTRQLRGGSRANAGGLKEVCSRCGHAKSLHYGPEGVGGADCQSLAPLIQCGWAEYREPVMAEGAEVTRKTDDDIGFDELGNPIALGDEAAAAQARIVEHPNPPPVLIVATPE